MSGRGSGTGGNPLSEFKKEVLAVAFVLSVAARNLGQSVDPVRDYYAALNILRSKYSS
jgi:hypothetical protein